MNKKTVKILSVLMALILLMCTFSACKGDESQYEKTGDVSTTASPEEPTTEAPDTVVPEDINPLTGLKGLSESSKGARPIAIMVENSPEARPQWGLSTPDLTIEGLAEGGVTRMMWVYADSEKIPDKVGPVRSARHDFVELAAGMNAIYAHWGGSDGTNLKKYMAYQAIEKFGVNNIDALKYEGSYFFRDTTRSVSLEHRGITTQKAIKNAISKLGFSTVQTDKDWTPYQIAVEGGKIPWGNKDNTGSCTEVSLTFSNAYKYTFKYDAETKCYYKYMNNKVVTDGNTGDAVGYKNVIYIYVPIESMNTAKGHVEWRLDAENIEREGAYVSEGIGQYIKWTFDKETGKLKLIDFNGNPLITNPGQVWLGIIPINNRATILD